MRARAPSSGAADDFILGRHLVVDSWTRNQNPTDWREILKKKNRLLFKCVWNRFRSEQCKRWRHGYLKTALSFCSVIIRVLHVGHFVMLLIYSTTTTKNHVPTKKNGWKWCNLLFLYIYIIYWRIYIYIYYKCFECFVYEETKKNCLLLVCVCVRALLLLFHISRVHKLTTKWPQIYMYELFFNCIICDCFFFVFCFF